jgi:hypothetical protein
MSKRDDLFDVDPPEEPTAAEGQGEDFFFEMNEEAPATADSRQLPDADADPAGAEDLPEKGSRGARRRLVPLLLLLVLLLAGGYLLLGDSLFAPEPAPQLVEAEPRKLKVPERETLEQEQAAVQDVVVPAEQVAGAPVAAPAEPAAETVPATAGAERTSSLAVEQPAAETVGQAAGSDAAGAESPAAATVAAAESAKPVAAAGGQGAYLLQIGAYVLEANLEQTLKTVRALGYQPLVSTGKKTVAMTRLRVGAYPQKQASEKLRELKQLAPAAFLLAEGERMALYAGSYFGLDRARVEADLLYQHDIHIDEETVSVAIPIRTVRFGAFSDAAAAEIVAEQTKKAGLDALVIKSGSEAAELLSALGG